MTIYLAQINIVLGAFNLIPGLPLDGGQVLKALVWKITGDRFAGVRFAAKSGQILGVVAVVLGAMGIVSNRDLSGLWLLMLGWFVMLHAGAYLQFANLQQSLLTITAEAAMTRDFRIVDGDLTLREFADKFLLMQEKGTDPVYFASANGRDRGTVLPEDLRYIERSEWEHKTLNDIAKPLASIDAVELQTKIPTVVNLLEEKQIRYITVLSQVGSVAGIVDRGDVIRALARKLNWRIPETYIQQVKSEGKFPPEFRLAEICAQL
jgi:CBS domain-containing protein